MLPKHQEGIYKALSFFIDALNREDKSLLLDKYNITAPVFNEIIEELERYPELRGRVELASFSEAFMDREVRPYIEIYEVSKPGVLGVECSLWLNGREIDSILHMEIQNVGSDMSLEYKYIAS